MEGLEAACGAATQPFLGLAGPRTSPTPSSEAPWSWEGQRHLEDGPTSWEVCQGPGVGWGKHSVPEESRAQTCLPLGPLAP